MSKYDNGMSDCQQCGYPCLPAQCGNPACPQNPSLSTEARAGILAETAKRAAEAADRDFLQRMWAQSIERKANHG